MPVTLNSHGVGKLVSVLVSVVDHTAPSSLLPTQLEMEAGVGIERLILGFPVFYEPRLQRVRDSSYTIRACSSSTPSLLVYWQFYWHSTAQPTGRCDRGL